MWNQIDLDRILCSCVRNTVKIQYLLLPFSLCSSFFLISTLWLVFGHLAPDYNQWYISKYWASSNSEFWERKTLNCHILQSKTWLWDRSFFQFDHWEKGSTVQKNSNEGVCERPTCSWTWWQILLRCAQSRAKRLSKSCIAVSCFNSSWLVQNNGRKWSVTCDYYAAWTNTTNNME